MPKPTDDCPECGAPAADWRPMRLTDLERLGAAMDVRDGMDAFKWIERYDVYVCGGGEHLTKTRGE